MFIKRTKKTVGPITYINHILVESVHTPKGTRHKSICSLGPLAPAPKEHWLALARKIERALFGQRSLIDDQPDQIVDQIVDKIKDNNKGNDRDNNKDRVKDQIDHRSEIIEVDISKVEVEDDKEAGPQHVAHQTWEKLGLDQVLNNAGLNEKTRTLTEIMVINRLVKPSSEHAMPEWIKRTAVADILGEDFERLNADQLYRNLDKLHPLREEIEKELAERERNLFNLKETIYLYDLTSTYFEGACEQNPKAKRGYSRDNRGDCKQVVIGLVLDGDGFPKAHEVFDGNRRDSTTVKDMLDVLETRVGKQTEKERKATVVVDRGMCDAQTLKIIQGKGYDYIVADRQSERINHYEEYLEEEGWDEVKRAVSPTNSFQKKSVVEIKRSRVKGETGETGEDELILCRSEGRKEKDRAIREREENKLLIDLNKLSERISKGGLVNEGKINQSIGRLLERYPRTAKYYQIKHDAKEKKLIWEQDEQKKERATRLDGGYILRTSRKDLTDEEVWKSYTLLTRVESAFRDMKSPLSERPIFHQLETRVETHIFLCVLAYHLLVAIERMFKGKGNTSWETLRERLSTHRVMTIVLPSTNGSVLRIRKATKPDKEVEQIYETLGIKEPVVRETRKWTTD